MKTKIFTTAAMLGNLMVAEQSHAMHPPRHGPHVPVAPDHVPEREYRTRPGRGLYHIRSSAGF